MLPPVAVEGNGLAACCSVRLLQELFPSVSFASLSLRQGPTLLINGQTQHLLTGIFGAEENLFSGSHPVRRRLVLWGRDEEVKAFPHCGLVVEEWELLQKLWRQVAPSSNLLLAEPGWCVRSGLDAGNDQHAFGTRLAASVQVALREEASDTCLVESLDSGWLFLTPRGNGSGALLAVGDGPERLLEQSRLVVRYVAGILGTGAIFPAYPRVAKSLCGPGWLACGSAAMGFDPICGEGAGHATRESILACAAVRAIAEGDPERDVLRHYAGRLLAGFLKHLTLCRDFYVSARRSDWWQEEILQLERGIHWAGQQLRALPAPQYRLAGLRLEKVV